MLFDKFLEYINEVAISRSPTIRKGWKFRIFRWRAHLARINAGENTRMLIIAAFIGIMGGLGAVFFRILIAYVQQLFYRQPFTLAAAQALPWYFKILFPAIGGLIVGPVVYFFAREAKGHGVPEVMEAVALRGGIIRPRVAVIKSLASAVCIGSGGSVGREGPIVQIGSAVGSTVGQILKLPPRKLRTLVGCGAAAGIAGTFNAPLAGVLFALEIILGEFGVTLFSPIVVSSVMATVVTHHFLGNVPAFVIPAYQFVNPLELAPYTILGILGGLISVAFILILYKSEDVFDDLKLPEPIKPMIGGVLIGIIALEFPNIYGVGYESIQLALHNQLPWLILLLLVVMKLLATSLTLGSGGSGGIFAPSLFIGAMTGGALGSFVHSMFPFSTGQPGAYALVGMGAVVAGTTRAPITAILILFELTNNYKIILPLMIACILSTLVSARLKRGTIYTIKLLRRGVNISKGQDVNLLKAISVKDIMSTNIETVPATTKLADVLEEIYNSPYTNFFVIDSNERLMGSIGFDEIRELLRDVDSLEQILLAEDIANFNVPVIHEHDTLDIAMRIFGEVHLDQIPVVTEHDSNRIIGAINRWDVINAYHRELTKSDLTGSMAGTIGEAEHAATARIGTGYGLRKMEVPVSFYGKTIRELDIRATYGVEVILIYRPNVKPEEDNRVAPHPDYEFTAGDVMLVAGKDQALRKLAKRT
jgi:CIC family chloride channel protein